MVVFNITRMGLIITWVLAGEDPGIALTSLAIWSVDFSSWPVSWAHQRKKKGCELLSKMA